MSQLLKEAHAALTAYAEESPEVNDLLGRIDNALAQPQQEPVRDLGVMRNKSHGYAPSAQAVASFNAAMSVQQPAQRKPLTDERIEEVRTEQEFVKWAISEGAFKYAARAIEAAHGIKDTP